MPDRHKRDSNAFPSTPTTRGQALTEMSPNPTTGRIAAICRNYNELPPGAPLMVVRYAKPSHPEPGARRAPIPSPVAIILAVKPAGSGLGRMGPEGAVLPVTKFAERASGRNIVVEKSIVIAPADIQGKLVEVFCGEAPIHGWIFTQSGQKPAVTWLSSEQLLVYTVCHLAASIEYKFEVLAAENVAVMTAIGERLKSLAEFATLKPRSARAIDGAREVVDQLKIVGLEEGAISGGLLVIMQKEVGDFMTALLAKPR